MKYLYLDFLMFMLFISGCASAPDIKTIHQLQAQVVSVSSKLELAKKENLDLKQELTLFKRTKDIDSEKFIEARDILQAALAAEEARKEAWIHLSDRGLVIIVTADELFTSGGADLTEGGKRLLDKIFNVIADRFVSNYIYVEGHTDNQSLAVFEWKSDWDFSFARALNVVQYFSEKKHMDPLRLSASGFGRYRPRQPNETKEGRRLNRRIEIVISPRRAGQIKQAF